MSEESAMSDIPTLYNHDFDRRSPAAKRMLSAVVAWSFERLKEFSEGSDVEDIETGRDGVKLVIGWDDYCRGCYMGRETETIVVPWEVFLSDVSVWDWKQEQVALAAKAKREREEAERLRKEAEAAAKEREEAEKRRRAKVVKIAKDVARARGVAFDSVEYDGVEDGRATAVVKRTWPEFESEVVGFPAAWLEDGCDWRAALEAEIAAARAGEAREREERERAEFERLKAKFGNGAA
jgi:hypothetical protein